MRESFRKKPLRMRAAAVLALAFCLVFSTIAYAQTPDYNSRDSWAYWQEGENKAADCFLVCPTIYSARGGSLNMPLDVEKINRSFVGALNMEKGIYSDTCRMYAPFYSQAALDVYKINGPTADGYFNTAYEDVRAAFLTYLEQENQGRPLVLAGFSQGADMCLRLMEEFFDDPVLQDRLVACYAIGWRVTEKDLEKYPHLRMAQSATDDGVIVAFNSESKETATSLLVPKSTLAINPLNWTSGSEYAPAALNKGACFTDYSGAVTKEIPNLTGAYLDPVRGTLKMDDSITPQEYPAGLDIFEDGVYHLYDYQFFYRNLQENVAQRTEAFLGR